MTTPTTGADGRVRAELLPGEHLLWEGRPDPRVHFTGIDAGLVPFSVLWCGFAVFWCVGVLQSSRPGFAAFGLVFVAIGLYFVFGRFIVKAWRKRTTVYAVTDRRALVVSGDRTVKQTPVRGQPTTIRRRSGHVSVVIGTPPSLRQAMYANTGLDLWGQDGGGVGLWDVADPDGLLAALRRAEAG